MKMCYLFYHHEAIQDVDDFEGLIDGLKLYGSLVDYCDVFISCLDSYSDGWHPFTTEAKLVSNWYTATFC